MFTWGVFAGISCVGLLSFILTALFADSCEYCGVAQVVVGVLAVMMVIPFTIMSFVLDGIASTIWSRKSVSPGFKWGIVTSAVQLMVVGFVAVQFELSPFSIATALIYCLIGAVVTFACLWIWHMDRRVEEHASQRK